MSKNVSIEEGDRARNFGPTAKIKTELQVGGYCYWVPEDERETGMVFALENREYTPDEIGKYGIDEIDINIIFTGIDPDGNPWSVIIDPDTGLPVIKYPDIEMLIDPETGNVIIEPIDGIEPIAEIDGDLLGDMGIDPTSDVDYSLDDPGDLDDPGSMGIVGDIDGIPSVADLDLDDMEWETKDCPKSIYVLSRPAGIVYTDGDTIDFTGLSIAALDKDGMDWPDPSVFTPIPASEIFMPTPTANISDASGSFATINGDTPAFEPSYSYYIKEAVYTIFGHICHGRLETRPENAGRIFVNKDSEGNYSYGILSTTGEKASVVVNYYGDDDGRWYGYDWPGVYESIPAPESDKPIESIESVDTKEVIVPVKVQWTSPCLETLETTFDITVYPKTDHGGSHHSGKF